MSRLRTSFRLSLEKLDDRLCLSGTTMDTFAVEALPPDMESTAHVRVFSGSTGDSSAYGGFTGGVRVAAGDLDAPGWGNDWISGGTGQDGVADVRTGAALHLKPLTPQAGAVDDVVVDGRIITAESPPQANGGAGLDVLIGNTGDDRIVESKVDSLSPTSASSSGANFVFCDGSVRFVSSTDLTVPEPVDQPAADKEYLHYTITLTNAR